MAVSRSSVSWLLAAALVLAPAACLAGLDLVEEHYLFQEYGEALLLLRQIAAADPGAAAQSVEHQVWLARCLVQAGEITEAIDVFCRVRYLDAGWVPDPVLVPANEREVFAQALAECGPKGRAEPPAPVVAEPVRALHREVKPNDAGLELLGRGLLYSFQYQYMVRPNLGLGAGLAAANFGDDDSSNLVVVIPIGARLYLAAADNVVYFAAGFSVLTAGIDSDIVDDFYYGFLGPGFELRSAGGFIFRGSAYLLVARHGSAPWPGVSFGFGF